MAETAASKPTVTLVGAGLAGTLMACSLARAGHRVDLYEKRPDPRSGRQEHGRSINLALSVRGIHALREIGLAEEVLKSSILMRGRMIHTANGEQAFQPYGKDDSQALHSVSRAGLNILLVEAAARQPSIHFSFERKCTGLDLRTGTLEFHDYSARSTIQTAAEFIIGADGVRVVEVNPAPPLGAFPFSSWPEHQLQLDRRETLMLYTDGLVERRRRLATIDPSLGVPDGIAVDADGSSNPLVWSLPTLIHSGLYLLPVSCQLRWSSGTHPKTLRRERGDGRRTLVHIDGIDEPLVASRSESAIAADLAAALGLDGPRGRRGGIPGQEALF